jgi:hypothetical protein
MIGPGLPRRGTAQRPADARAGLPVEHGGERYLVSTRGESDWVRNLRAAGGGRLTRRGRTDDFAADEIPVDSRPPVLSAYREKAGREVQRFFDRVPDPPTTRSS